MIALSVLIFIYNFFNSIKNGEKAEGNVWNSRSPEWQVPSPMPTHNYDQPFEVVGEPYDYGLPAARSMLNLPRLLLSKASINKGEDSNVTYTR